MPSALVVAIIGGLFAILGKLLDTVLSKGKTQDIRKPGKAGDLFDPRTPGGILNPSTAILLIVGVIVGLVLISLPPSPPDMPPELFIRTYWERVSGAKYDESWAMLTDNFKCTHFPPCEGGKFDFEQYKRGFANYSEVDVRNAHVVNQDANSADIDLDLEYHWRDGTITTSTNFNFHLVAEPNWPLLKRSWYIDKVTQSG